MTVHFVITQIFGNITSMNYTVIGVFWSQTYLGTKCLLLLNTKLNLLIGEIFGISLEVEGSWKLDHIETKLEISRQL